MVLAAGQIGGISEEQRFLLDTGTAPSILNVRTAKSMGLQITDTTIEAVGRRVRVGRTVLPEVEMGPIHVKSLAMNVADLSQWEELLGVKLAGLIGMDVLGRANFVLDYDSGKLELGGVPEAGMPVRYDRSRAVALADVTLQGKTLHLIVDTGSDAVVIYGDNWEGKAGRTLQGRSIAEPVATKRIKRTGLMVGKNYFSRVPIYCVPTGKGADNDGFLGVKALRLRGISFDREKQVLYLLD